jgi:hypothetical protein
VSALKRNKCLFGPFFAEIRPVFHGGQFQIFGDFLLFLAEVVEFDLRNLRRVFFIYCMESNVWGGRRDHDLVFVNSSQSLLYFSSIQ